jgi:hypothetical protein
MLINKQYNTQSAGHHDDSDKYFEVPFVGQNHLNLCLDASANMLCRWANTAPPGLSNLKYQVAGYNKIRKFIKEVDNFKNKSRDKLRDEAVSIFDQYLNPATQESSNNHILKICRIEPMSVEFLDLHGKIDDCRLKKQQRDKQFNGILNRWARHLTKAEGYVVDHNVFDPVLKTIQHSFFNSQNVAEFIKNPRFSPLRGMNGDEMMDNFGSVLEDFELQDPTTFDEWTAFMDRHGPVIVSRWTKPNIPGIPSLGHAIVIVGYVRVSQYLIYHDPWVGPDQRGIYTELYNAMGSDAYTVRQEFNPVLRSAIGNA